MQLHQNLTELAGIGAIPGDGVCRLAFSSADLAGRNYIEAHMRELGLEVSIDDIGNILGVRPGAVDGPLVLTGSHTDTVVTGGRFDGSLGVLAGLEVIAQLNEAGIQTHLPIGVISFVNEEGARFMPDMMGSLYLTGQLQRDEILSITGVDGTTIGENIDHLDYAGTAEFDRLDIAQFIELHIEQGPVLEAENLTIGVVERVQGIRWLEIAFSGVANHAGATPMRMRHDAGFAAGALIQQVRQLAEEMGENQRTTVGSVQFSPNVINVIPARAVVTVDLRNPGQAALDAAESSVREMAAAIAQSEGLTLDIRKLAHVDPVEFDAGCIRAIERAAASLDYSHRRMMSGAAHDAQIMASRYPAAMIFVPSKDGISHNVTEYTAPEHIEAGAKVLFQTLLILANPSSY